MRPYADRSHDRHAELEAGLDRIVMAARRFDDVRAVYVFGSLARGTVGPRSDLDVLLVRETLLRGPARGEDVVEAALPGVAFDLVVLTPVEFEERRYGIGFWHDVLADARCVYAARP